MIREETCLIHGVLHYLVKYYDDLPEKFPAMWGALSGMGLVSDHEISDTLTEKQAKAIMLEFVQRVFSESQTKRF